MGFLNRLTGLFRRNRLERDLDEELQFHIELKTRDNIAAGMLPEEARYAALRAFGGVAQKKEECRDAWGLRFVNELLQDLRYGLRQLRRNPGFTAVAVLTLALGIGANTAIFSLLDPLLLRKLPVPNPQELVCVSSAGSLGNAATGYSSELQAYKSYRDHAQVFSGVLAFSSPRTYEVSQIGNTNSADGEIVSGNYFAVLGLHPYVGSYFTGRASQEATGNPVVLGFNFWQKAFSGEREVIGKPILIGKAEYTIVGVTPPGFFGTVVGESPDFYLPLDGHLSKEDKRRTKWLFILGRMKPGINLEQARAALNPLFKQIARASPIPEVEKRESMARLVLTPANRGLSDLRKNFGFPAKVLMGVVGLILLIACANVANLFLAFGASHRREMAVRLALGAGRWRLSRLLLARAALVATAGAGVGLLAAKWTAATLLASLSTATSPVVLKAGLSIQVLVFTAGITVLTVLIAGLVPIFFSRRVNLTENLKTHPGGGFLLQRSRTVKGLLVAQISFCAILLASAGLLLHSLVILETMNPGFDRNHILAVTLHSTAQNQIPGHQSAAYTELLRRVESLPGVNSAAYSAFLPISGRELGVNITIEGYTLGRSETANTFFDPVSPGYFKTMGIPLMMGRGFRQEDVKHPVQAAVINQAMAHRFFGSNNPLGKHLRFVEGKHPPTLEIIGVVANSKYNSLREKAQDFFYVPVAYGQSLDVHTTGAPDAIASTIRKAITLNSASIEVTRVRTLREQIDQSLHQDRLLTALCGVFGMLALVLACIGLYGVLSFNVAQRTSEIGIRLALGAEKRDVLKMVIGQGLKLALIGVTIGIAGALALTRFLTSLLYGVTATDPLTFIAVSLILIAVALLACYIPARRAAKVDPMVALRYE